MAELKTSSTIEAQDCFSGVAKKITAAGGKLAECMEEMQKELASLGKQFGALKKAPAANGAEMKAAREHATSLGKQIAETHRMDGMGEAANLSLIGGSVERAGRGLLAALESPLRSAVNFESVMADVRKSVDFESPQQFQAMSRDILKLSGEIPITAAGLGEIVAAAGQAGIAREELIRFASDAAKMSVAFYLSGAEAGSAMRGLRATFKLNQDEVVSLGDAYNHLSNNMDATARDMLTIANRTGSAAREFGLSGRQVGALGAAFLALKTSPEIAATGINAMLTKLQAADEQGRSFQDALGSIGLSAEGLKQSIEQDAQGALIGFLEAVRGADDVKGTLADLFGPKYVDDMQKLVGGLDIYWQAVGLATDEGGSAGSMQAEFAARSKTAANAALLLDNRLEALKIMIGDTLLPKLEELLPLLSEWVDQLTELLRENPKLTQGLVAAAGALGLTATTAGPVLSAAAWLQLKAARAQLAAAGGNVGGIGGLFGRRKAGARKAWESLRGAPSAFKGAFKARGLGGVSRVAGGGALATGKNLIGDAAKHLKGKGGLLGAGIATFSIGSTLLDDKLSGREKAEEITRDAGGIGGALAGGALGAAVGSAVPVIGTALGGIVGSIAGGLGGGALGAKLGSLFRDEVEHAPDAGGRRTLTKAIGTAAAGLALTLPAAAATSGAAIERAPILAPAPAAGTPGTAAAGLALTLPAAAATPGSPSQIDNSIHIQQLTVHQQPGEDAVQLAERLIREIEYRWRVSRRGALYDEL